MSQEATASKYDPPPGVVALGVEVEVELVSREGDRERHTFDIVPEPAADFDAGFLSITTPLARTIVGRSAGAEVSYQMGDVVKVRVLSVRRSERRPAHNAASERDAATREAVQRAKTDETIQLALTFSSKWGDYDPEPLERNTQRADDEANASDAHDKKEVS